VLGSDNQAKLTRSTTLHRSSLSEVKQVWKKTPEFEGLVLEQEMMEKLRRWILGIAVGTPEFRSPLRR
jgi:hypothetical protein